VFEYDSKYVFVSLAEARRLLGAQAQDGFRILLTDPSAAPAIAANLRQRLGDSWKVESWDIQNKKLFAALKLERLAMSGILLLIILIASFSIVGVLMMVVSSKRKDIAILRSMGMNARSIRKIFLMYGMRIGTVGSLLGGLLGSALCLALTRWPIRLPASYYLDILPVSWSLVATIIFITSGIVIAMIASLYPISQATSEDPVAILRYE
jgi:lipoprotein-releasing system permease protein